MLGRGKTADRRVAGALVELGLKYEVDKDGDFRLIFMLGDERTQVVWINSDTSQYHNLEIREVWSPAGESIEPFPAEVSFHLLRSSRGMKLGAWEVAKMGDTYYAVFSAKISADADPLTLKAVLKFVSQCADEMEKELMGGDAY